MPARCKLKEPNTAARFAHCFIGGKDLDLVE